MSDDQVGYKRPPKKYRFKKGQSGNPSGRPRKPRHPVSTSEAEIMRRLDNEIIEVGGRSMTWQEAEIHMLWGLAVAGNSKAKRLIDKLRAEASRKLPRGGVVRLPLDHPFWRQGDGK